MRNLIEDFKMYLDIDKGMSENTVYNYGIDLEQFDYSIRKDLLKVEANDVKNYLRNLKNKNGEKVEATTRNRKLSSIKRFYKWIVVEEKLLKINPAENIENTKQGKRLPKPVTDDNIDKLVASIDNLRDLTMFELFYATGIRRTELIKIRRFDFNFEEKTLRVIGKGNKERIVPVHDDSLKLCRQLLDQHGSVWLFPSRKNTGDHIGTWQVNNIFKELKKKAGIDESISITPHKLRHSIATHLLREGMEITYIQKILGHSNLATTQLYTEVADTQVHNEYQNFHPRAKKQAI